MLQKAYLRFASNMSVLSKHMLAYYSSSRSWGGLEMNHIKNAHWMNDKGHHVIVFGVHGAPFVEAAREIGLTVVYIEPHRKYYDFSKGKALARLLAKHAVTHLIVRDNRDLSIAVIAKRYSKNKIHLSYFMEMQLGVQKKSFFHTLRYKYLDLWSCPLSWLKDQVLTMTHMPKDRITVIHSGVELKRFNVLPEMSFAREKLQLPQDAILVGLIGRFDVHKNQHVLINALSLIQNQNVHVCLIGESTRGESTNYEQNMYALIHELDLTTRVHIRPFTKDIETFYAAMDLIVMATQSETVGMVTIEAMACGKQIIATNTGGSPELLNFGQLGKLVEPSNPQALANEIEEFASGSWKIDHALLLNRAAEFDHLKVCETVEKNLCLLGI